MITRSFPEAREFLTNEVLGLGYPVKHLIEQARSKGHITRGKQGRGGGVVTSRDMAMLLAGALVGDTPQVASDAMGYLSTLIPNTLAMGTEEITDAGFKNDQWNRPFIEVIANIIDGFRENYHADFALLSVSVEREPIIYGKITWNLLPFERDGFLCFEPPGSKYFRPDMNTKRRITASFDAVLLRSVADWLEGREGH